MKKGDTLDKIAKEQGSDPKKIAEANGLQDPNAIKEGQKLKIPK